MTVANRARVMLELFGIKWRKWKRVLKKGTELSDRKFAVSSEGEEADEGNYFTR